MKTDCPGDSITSQPNLASDLNLAAYCTHVPVLERIRVEIPASQIHDT